jgi:hypothetical protein
MSARSTVLRLAVVGLLVACAPIDASRLSGLVS